ncbi:hypothetical protein SAMN04488111_3357 [Lutibacter flavus]|uniref:DUF5916 domain-containing protein n=2 Tax=Lutibacter flavus TaxID=691689 RepID=A0A238ZJR4_9FLAO|nr:hypothetical protein SAMN04488111_3357 [Lutibacter flavus]
MHRRLLGNILIITLLTIFNTYSQDGNKKIEFVKEKISIDGNLNEPVWKCLISFDHFFNHFPNDTGTTEKPVIVKAFHDGENLYFGVVIHEKTDKYLVNSMNRDMAVQDFLKEDSFVIILDTFENQSSGIFFVVNVLGAQTDGLIAINSENYSPDIGWNTKWNSQVKIEGNLRFFEIAIPLNAIAYDLNKSNWNINFASVDAKTSQYSTLTSFSRNYDLIDLRFTQKVEIVNLPKRKSSKLSLIPSTSFSYTKDVINSQRRNQLNFGLDAKYNVTSSLKLDVAINPDFSQIEQDDQIANLTRFDISLPEKRNFFLENGDLFNNLGARGVNPFYSRKIGLDSEIIYGVKLSGELSKNLRVGLLNTQTESIDSLSGYNFSALVAKKSVTKSITTTGYIINKQNLNTKESVIDYNRVLGLNMNYKSQNKKWLGQLNYGKSFTSLLDNKNNFYSTNLSYSTRKWIGSTSMMRTEKNFVTSVGFTPRIKNYDAGLDQYIRKGYWANYTEIIYNNYSPNDEIKDKNEHKLRVNTFLNSNLELVEENIEFVNIWRKKDLSYFFANVNYNYNNLKFATNIINSNKPLPPNNYNDMNVRIGYISPFGNKIFSHQNRLLYGTFYNGTRFNWEVVGNVRLQPWASMDFNYNLNLINLYEYGKETIHTFNFSGKVFFNTKLMTSANMSYSTRQNDISMNARLQWEFKPLSYVYLVFSNSYYTDNLKKKSYGVALKINYWLDI